MDAREIATVKLEIAEREKAIVDLGKERVDTYNKVKDFSSADAVTTDRAINHMKQIDLDVRQLQKEIRTRQLKLNPKFNPK